MPRPNIFNDFDYSYPLSVLLESGNVDFIPTVATTKTALLALAFNSEGFYSLRGVKVPKPSPWSAVGDRTNVFNWVEAQELDIDAVFINKCIVFLRKEDYSPGVYAVINWKKLFQNYATEAQTLPVVHLFMLYLREFLASKFVEIPTILNYSIRYAQSMCNQPFYGIKFSETALAVFATTKLNKILTHLAEDPVFIHEVVNIFNVLMGSCCLTLASLSFPKELSHWETCCTVVDLTQLTKTRKPQPSRVSPTTLVPFIPIGCDKTSELFLLSNIAADPYKLLSDEDKQILNKKCGIVLYSTAEEDPKYLPNIEESNFMVLHVPTVKKIRSPLNVVGYESFSLDEHNGKFTYVLEATTEYATIVGSPKFKKILELFGVSTMENCSVVDIDSLARAYSSGSSLKLPTGLVVKPKQHKREGSGRPARSLETSTFKLLYPKSSSMFPFEVEFIFPINSTFFRIAGTKVEEALLTKLEWMYTMFNSEACVHFRGYASTVRPVHKELFNNTYFNKIGLATLLQHPDVHKHIPGWSEAWLKEFLRWLNEYSFTTKPPFAAVRDSLKQIKDAEGHRAYLEYVFTPNIDSYIRNEFRGQRGRLFDFSDPSFRLYKDIPIKLLFERVEYHRNHLLERGEFDIDNLPHVVLTQNIKDLVDKKLYGALLANLITDAQYLHIFEQNAKHRVYLDDKQLIKKLEKK